MIGEDECPIQRKEPANMKTRYTLRCNLTIGYMVEQLLVWALLSIVTLGIATLFFPYYAMKLMLNHTELCEVEESRIPHP